MTEFQYYHAKKHLLNDVLKALHTVNHRLVKLDNMEKRTSKSDQVSMPSAKGLVTELHKIISAEFEAIDPLANLED